MHRAILIAAVVLTACTTADDDTDKDPFVPTLVDTAIDTDPPEETGDTDTDIGPRPRDTGFRVVVGIEGYAELDTDNSWSGWEATTFRWIDLAGERSKPKCVYAQEILDWSTDTDEPTPDPLGAQHTCPGCCDDCTFSFTLSYGDQSTSRDLPWDPQPEPVSDDLQLSCENLADNPFRIVTVPPRTNMPPTGYGFKPSDTDATVGNLMIWVQNQAVWSAYDPFSQDATYDNGIFQWAAEGEQFGYGY